MTPENRKSVQRYFDQAAQGLAIIRQDIEHFKADNKSRLPEDRVPLGAALGYAGALREIHKITADILKKDGYGDDEYELLSTEMQRAGIYMAQWQSLRDYIVESRNDNDRTL